MRYQIRDGSQTAHCCFGFTVVDTQRPEMVHGKPYVPDGVPRYEIMCECFDEEEARTIVAALNLAVDMTVTARGGEE